MAKRGEKAMGGKKSASKSKGKKSGKHVHEIVLRRAKSGELLAKHRHMSKSGEPAMEDEEHVVAPGSLDDHVEQHMPMQQEEQAPAPAGAQPNPMGGGAMMGGM
jgi:hypothetical protein